MTFSYLTIRCRCFVCREPVDAKVPDGSTGLLIIVCSRCAASGKAGGITN